MATFYPTRIPYHPCPSNMASTGYAGSISQSEELFWERQESMLPQHDHPQMCSNPVRSSHPNIEIFIATAAGKPLYHFAYKNANAQSGSGNEKGATQAQGRPAPSITTLSAALTAFQSKTNNRVSVIRTNSASLLFHIHDTFHIALLSRQQPAPLLFQQALLRMALAAIQTALSASLSEYLRERPNARPSFKAAEPLLNSVLLEALTHPLPYALQKPIALPSRTQPTNRQQLSELLRDILQTHSNLKHALLFTVGPPYPVQIVSSVSPSNMALTQLDTLLLGAYPHTAVGEKGQDYFPQASAFRCGVKVFSRLLHMRLHPDHHDAFKRAVGESDWRPEWTRSPPHTLRIMALGHGSATQFFDDVESALDRALMMTQILMCLEKPFEIEQFGVRDAMAVFYLQDDKRLAATQNAFTYKISIAVLQALANARGSEKKRRDERRKFKNDGVTDHRGLVLGIPQWDLRVVIWESRIAVCFKSCVDERNAVLMTRDVFVPAMDRCALSIIPEYERALIHPKTPLSGLMAPFES